VSGNTGSSRILVPLKGHRMTTPQQLLAARRRRQILDDEILERFEPDKPEPKSPQVTYFISHLIQLRRQALRFARYLTARII
jgi:hypothetical protein